MTEKLQEYENSIKKKHSFGWTPEYEEDMHTSLNKAVFSTIAIRAFEEIGWDVVYGDEGVAEAKRSRIWTGWSEKISVVNEFGTVKVKSISLGNEMWDNGRNSKRVKLFIYTFQQIEKELDRETLGELEKEIEKTKTAKGEK